MEKLGVDHSTLSRYRRVVTKHDSRSKKGRERLTARRLAGGGRKTVLTDEQEAALEEWIMGKRRDKLRVTEKMVKDHARAIYGIKASNMVSLSCCTSLGSTRTRFRGGLADGEGRNGG